MQNQQWSRAVNAPRGLRPRPAARRQSPNPIRHPQNNRNNNFYNNRRHPVEQKPAMPPQPTNEWDSAWNMEANSHKWEGPAWAPVNVPEGCDGLVDWNGNWAPAPVDWEGRRSYDISEAYIHTWNKGCIEALKDELYPMPLEHGFAMKGKEILAVFTTSSTINGKSTSRTKTGNAEIMMMGDIAPRYWKPESVENNLNADSFWEYFRTAPPDATEDDHTLALGTRQPFWRYYCSPGAYYMPAVVDECDNLKLRIDPNSETLSEKDARENDHGSESHAKRYLASKKYKGKRKQGRNQCRDNAREERHRPGLSWDKKPQEEPTFNPAQNTTTWEADFPSLPITGQMKPGAAPPSPPLSVKPHPDTLETSSTRLAPANATPEPWVSTKPPIDIVIRPATDQDIGQLTSIYNHHVLNSVCVPDAGPTSISSMTRRLHTIQDASFPFLVAVRARTSTVVGMVYADDYNDPRGMYRYTCEVEVYVSPHHTKKGVGTALMKTILHLLDREVPRDPPAGVEIAPDTELGPRRPVKSLIIHLPFMRRKKPEWVFQWLAKLGWVTKGVMDEMGFSREGKGVDLAMLQRLTSEVLEGSKVPVVGS
ncbi:hypothetical protein BDZ85DRAFT_306658 [Elsinoe ampelina]|uniref:N-acetyltransferase domain-containing protein n=1 Tax=Elsinoe ampelina TaxID=302913 RepID=A0A6A6FZX2_9PEZI|nr:hypothetical protein BDZ85DRAFT_306658 [Elsinoe ampelina]